MISSLALVLTLPSSQSFAGPPSSSKSSSPATVGTPARGDGGDVFVPGIRDASRQLPGEWVRDLERRKAILAKERGRSPRAIGALLLLLGDLGGELPHEQLHDLLTKVERDPSRSPLLRAHASYVRGTLFELSGQRARAYARYDAAGFVRQWQVLGPFDNNGGTGHDGILPPETEPYVAGQSFPAMRPGDAVSWQLASDEHHRNAFIDLDDRLSPGVHVSGFLSSWIYVPQATTVGFHLGSAGKYKLWVDSVLLGEGGGERPADPLQESHGAKVTAGWHRVLIKLSVEERSWGGFLRISDESGAPLRGVRISATPPQGNEEIGAVVGPTVVESLRGQLEKAAAAEKPKIDDLLALTGFYLATAPFPAGDRSAVSVARRADAIAQSIDSAWMLARAESDPKLSRVALESGVERSRAKGDKLTANERITASKLLADLALRELKLGLRRRAIATFAEARAVAPDSASIELVMAGILSSEGFELAALRWIEDIHARYPESTMAAREHARQLDTIGRKAAALEIRNALAQKRPTDRELAELRISAMLELDRSQEALTTAQNLCRDRGRNITCLWLEAGVHLARRDPKAAAETLRASLALNPHNADTHADLGDMLAKSGLDQDAIASWQRSLEIKPQQPELRDRVAALDPNAGAGDVFGAYALDLETVGAQPTPDGWGVAGSGRLAHRVAVRVLPNGLSERLDHRIIRIVNERGARDQELQAINFDPSQATMEVRRARVRRADGRIEDLGRTNVLPIGEAGYRMYYDQRQVQVTFPTLRPGDTLEVAFLRRDTAAANMFGKYFGDVVPLQGTEASRIIEYILEAPIDRKLYFSQEVKREEDPERKLAIYRITRKDVAPIKPEARMPGWSEIADYVHVSTYATWDEVGRWYWGLVRGQLVVDDRIRDAVKDVIGKLPANASTRDKIAALYTHVVRSTRYIGLEFGIHGFKPYRTTEVYDRRFGDCKDKASLLKVMLAEIGIEARLVLVRTRDLGTIGERPASLSVFNHAIVYVPSEDLFLDGTAEWSGASELPANDQGATVLVVEDGTGAKLRQIPFSKPEDNLESVVANVELHADGSALISQTVRIAGHSAAGVRSGLQNEAERRSIIGQALSQRYPGAELRELTVSNVNDINATVELSYVFTAPNWAKPAGEGMLRMPARGHDSALLRNLAPQLKRKFPLVMGVPAMERQTLTVTLPPGWSPSSLPKSGTRDGEHIQARFDVKHEGQTVTMSSEYVQSATVVSPAGYSKLRETLTGIDTMWSQTLELRRTGAN